MVVCGHGAKQCCVEGSKYRNVDTAPSSAVLKAVNTIDSRSATYTRHKRRDHWRGVTSTIADCDDGRQNTAVLDKAQSGAHCGVLIRPPASHDGEPSSTESLVLPELSRRREVSDVFIGLALLYSPRHFFASLLHLHFVSLSSVLKKSDIQNQPYLRHRHVLCLNSLSSPLRDSPPTARKNLVSYIEVLGIVSNKTSHQFSSDFSDYLLAHMPKGVRIDQFTWKFQFRILPGLSHDLLLGVDFLGKTQVNLDVSKKQLIFAFCQSQTIGIQAQPFELHKILVQAVQELSVVNDQENQLTLLRQEFSDVVTPKLCHNIHHPVVLSLMDCEPVSSVLYRVAPSKLKVFREMIDKLQEDDIVERSSIVIQVLHFYCPKKKTPGEYKAICDYRKVNQKIFINPYPLPTIDSVFQHVGNVKYFSIFDLNSAFLQCELHPDAHGVLAFVTHGGQYQRKRLPMG
ncbi:hypothetical protein PR048_016638 [Dryococelus australis]|uniref:Reverse transcriptase domain-containing protein n=1 Tax=Dryococelus australis TaxID=614101 RepID=A0ABQ9H793_9NEOP|nr:hypothetical protein PR048_016638 [Dryococelus australis]